MFVCRKMRRSANLTRINEIPSPRAQLDNLFIGATFIFSFLFGLVLSGPVMLSASAGLSRQTPIITTPVNFYYTYDNIDNILHAVDC